MHRSRRKIEEEKQVSPRSHRAKDHDARESPSPEQARPDDPFSPLPKGERERGFPETTSIGGTTQFFTAFAIGQTIFGALTDHHLPPKVVLPL